MLTMNAHGTECICSYLMHYFFNAHRISLLFVITCPTDFIFLKYVVLDGGIVKGEEKDSGSRLTDTFSRY